MTRALSSGVTTEIAKPVIAPIYLIEAEFSGGPIRISTANREIEWDGKTWAAMGYLLAISPLTDTQTIEANGMTITLSGVPSELIATVYGEYAQGRPCVVWLGFLNDSDQLIADPVRINRGRMDAIADEDDGNEVTISVTVENGMRDLRKPSVRRYTNEDQQRLFAGDRGAEFVAGLQEKEVFWGRAGESGL